MVLLPRYHHRSHYSLQLDFLRYIYRGPAALYTRLILCRFLGDYSAWHLGNNSGGERALYKVCPPGQRNKTLAYCHSVGRFRASRDVPLPYDVASSSSTTLASKSPNEPSAQRQQGDDATQAGQDELHRTPSRRIPHTPKASGTDLERAASDPDYGDSSLRRRKRPPVMDSPVARAINRVGTMMHTAHAEDFERKRKPELGKSQNYDDDDEEDDDEEGDSDSEAEQTVQHVLARDRARAHGHSNSHRREPDPEHVEANDEGESDHALALAREVSADERERNELRAVRSALDAAHENDD